MKIIGDIGRKYADMSSVNNEKIFTNNEYVFLNHYHRMTKGFLVWINY